MADSKKQVRPGGPHGRGHGYQRPQNLRGTVGKLLAYIGRYKAALIVVAVCLVLSSVGSVASSYFLKPALNHIVAGDFKGLFWMLVAMGGVFLVSAGCSYAYSRIMVRISQRTVATLRQDLFNKLQTLPLRYFDTHQSGDLMSRFTNDMDTVSDMISNSFASVVSNLLTFVCTVVMLVYLNWALTLITFVFLGLMLLVVKSVGGRSRTSFQQQQAALGSLNGYIEEVYQGQELVSVFNYTDRAKEEFDRINGELQRTAQSAEIASGKVTPITDLVNNLGYAVSALLGCLSVLCGEMRIGDVQAMLQYTKQFSQPFASIAGMAGSFSAASAAAGRIFALLDASEETPDPVPGLLPQVSTGAVEFRHVSFGYSPEHQLMHDVNITVKSGQKVAIVGPTGAGKTTLINLLMRFYDVDGGSILVDGVDTKEMTRHELRDRFGMVLQDAWLFEGSIRDNIAYAQDNLPEEKIIAAARSASVDSFIKTLPGGYDFELSTGAENISQGQRQLLTIARAMASDPEIMILDEATSNVDTHTEQLIQKALAKLMHGRTSFVIAHRLSTIRDADMILYMEHGDILEHGSHEELMAQHGKYEALYMSQFAQ